MTTQTLAAGDANLSLVILERLRRAGASVRYGFERTGQPKAVIDGHALARRIQGFATSFRQTGLSPGSVVPLLAPTSPELWASFVGAIAADLSPAIFAVPTLKTHLPTYTRNLTGLMARYRSHVVVTDRSTRAVLSGVLGAAGVQCLDMDALAAEDATAPRPRRSGPDTAFLQHSSGSTGTPKGVALSHQAVLGHLGSYARTIDLDPRHDVIASWLPLYHDMGLVTSFLMPLSQGVSVHSLNAQDWILQPASILRVLTEERATLSWWPNFTLSLLAQRVRPEDRARYDLRHVRKLVNCSEPILGASREAFLEAFAAQGVSRSQLQTSYALAENVFAATQSGSTGPLEVAATIESLEMGRDVALVEKGSSQSRSIVSSGRTMSTVGLEIVNPDGLPLPDGRVGEITLSGPSLFSGYHLLPEATAPVLNGGSYRTGDLGFLHRDEVFVLGRQSDLLIVGGRKHYPNDIEGVANEVEGVKNGRVVAFGVTSEQKGTEEVVVLAESPESTNPIAALRIRREIKARAIQRVDCAVDRVLVLPPQTLIKTSSGKIARRDNREAYLRDVFGA